MRPVVWLIWDGAAEWVVSRLLREGCLPALRGLIDGGVRAAALPPFPNVQTPPALATLFTGLWPSEHGITGFHVPVADVSRPVTDTISGFDTAALQRDPVWRWVGKQARQSVLVHIPWALAGNAEDRQRVFAIQGFSRCLARAGAIAIHAAEPDHLAEIEIGPFRCALSLTSRGLGIRGLPSGIELSIPHASLGRVDERHVLRLTADTAVCCQTWKRSGDGSLLFIHFGAWRAETWPVEEADGFDRVAGPFLGEGLGRLFRSGAFGTPLAHGGNGEAEKVLVATTATLAEHFEAASLAAVRRRPDAHLYILYQPCIDEIEHELLGWCDSQSVAYRPEIAEPVWACIRSVYERADRHLARILEEFGDDCDCIVSSDHGMVGIRDNVYVNEVLRRAGLLEFDGNGHIDLPRTSALYHPANNGSVWINDESRPCGRVPASKRDQVQRRAEIALRGLLTDAATGPVFTAIYPLDRPPIPKWPRALGDFFLAVADGFNLRPEPSPTGDIFGPAHKAAAHVTYSKHPSLRGILCARGRGLPRNLDLVAIDNRHVAGVVAAWLGLRPNGTPFASHRANHRNRSPSPLTSLSGQSN